MDRDTARLYRYLKQLFWRLQIPVRSELFDPRLFGDAKLRGGLCWVRSAPVVLLDARASTPDRVVILLGALLQLQPTLPALRLPAWVRAALLAQAAGQCPLLPPAPPARPQLRLVPPPAGPEPPCAPGPRRAKPKPL